jgi:hypothetical protein
MPVACMRRSPSAITASHASANLGNVMHGA